MEEFLIVDGYNILHAWPSLRKYLNESLEHARVKLIEKLSNYQALKGLKVIVVFDAHHVKGGSGGWVIEAGVEVIYSPQGTTADAVIEKLAGQLVEKGSVLVATSDWLQQRMVFGKGAIRLSARELEEEVDITCQNAMPYYAKEVISDGHIGHRIAPEVQKTMEKWRRKK